MNRVLAARLAAGFLFLLLIGPANLRAADDNTVIFPASASRAESKGAQTTASGSITLVAGIVLAGVGGWFVWQGRRKTHVSGAIRHLVIDETRSLGSRQYLVVASYQDKKYLLGVCPGRIDLLTPLSAANAEESFR